MTAPPALSFWLHIDSMNTVSCQSTGFQGYMAQGKFGAGFDDVECQAQLMAGLAVVMQSLDSGVPMWRACQPPAPAGNAQTPFPPWNLLPAVRACPLPASAASTDPANPHPTWGWKYSPQPTGHSSPRWGTLWVSKEGHCPHRPFEQSFCSSLSLAADLLCDIRQVTVPL